ncbi:MAG: NAD-dependent epimerase/dehydratase family protein [Gaiellaceae bacterium]
MLVTGATGFIGRHALPALQRRGFEVHAAARSGGSADGVAWHAVDLLDARAVEQLVGELEPSHLLHLAWYAEHGLFWEAPENLDWVAASARLLRSFAESGGGRVVVAGTCAEYDWTADCCDPSTPIRPATLYGACKSAFRQILEAYASTAGLNAAWGRIFFTFGPGEQPGRLIASVARALVTGATVDCSSGAQLRDLLYVEEVADAFAAILDSEIVGALDVGSGEPHSLRETIERLERLGGGRAVARFGELPQRDEPHRIVADIGRLRDEVGWRPRRSLDDGLARTLEWWRSNSDLAEART